VLVLAASVIVREEMIEDRRTSGRLLIESASSSIAY
jgi:hypothetical protein